MQRYKLAGCAAVLLLAAVSTVRSDNGLDPFAMAEDPRIPHLISLLADPDPLVRTDSVQRLRNLGEAARPALRRAIASATPATRSEIDQILLHIPWVQPGDSEAVDQAFTGYAELSAEDRCTRIDGWMAPLQAAGSSALLRVVLNDPSPAVRWEAADALRMSLDDNAPLGKKITELVADPTGSDQQYYLSANDNAPLVALAGWVVRATSAKHAADLLEQAVLMEQEHPSAFRGQMDFALLWLIDRANLSGDHARAVLLLRAMADRSAWNDQRLPEAVSSLFAAQAEYGPFPGFGDDLRCYREYFTHPEMVYALARLAQRQGYHYSADAMNTTALLMSGSSAEAHYVSGSFLASHGWNLQAERELKWSLHLTGDNAVNIYFQLSVLADRRDDDLASARYMEAGLQKLTDSKGLTQTNRYGQATPLSVDDLWAQVHYHYLRAAAAADDKDGVKLHLKKLLSMDQEIHVLERDPGMAADIVPALQQLGREKEADIIFETSYNALKEKCDQAAEDPMARNNLAWLCACAGKRLDEAAILASAAVAQNPDDAACLDTQAEVYLKQGHPVKAVQIETHALQIKPDDVYMTRQLEKFKTAATKTN